MFVDEQDQGSNLAQKTTYDPVAYKDTGPDHHEGDPLLLLSEIGNLSFDLVDGEARDCHPTDEDADDSD